MAKDVSELVTFGENMVTIEGLRGLPADNSRDWVIDIDFLGKGNYILVQVSPSSVVRDIEKVIEGDRAEGKEDKIDHVMISNRYAVILFLEGRLTRDVLANAKVEGDNLVVNMYLAGATRKVVIQSEQTAKYHCATYTADGQVV